MATKSSSKSSSKAKSTPKRVSPKLVSSSKKPTPKVTNPRTAALNARRAGRPVPRTGNQSAATRAVHAQPKTGKPGFAPGTRPGVITVSGQNVFRDNKLVKTGRDAADAQAYAEHITSPQGKDGKILNIMGDKSGETYRMLNRVNRGTQTGQANIQGIVESAKSRGLATQLETKDGQTSVTGMYGKKTAQKVADKEFERQQEPAKAPQTRLWGKQAPVLRDASKEAAKRAELLTKFGVKDESQLNAAQRMLLEENVNTQVYGRARPLFKGGPNVLDIAQQAQEQALSATLTKQDPVATQEAVEAELDATPREITTIVTSDEADEYTEQQLSNIGIMLSDSSETANYALNDLIATDPDVLAAEQEGAEMQALLAERQKFYEEQYNSLRSEIQQIYDNKEADMAIQAQQAMGASISQLAAMGIYGVSSAAVQYVDDVNRQNQARMTALAAEESAALQSAYNSFVEADFGVAEKMLQNAAQTRETIRGIKNDALNRQAKMIEIKRMEREDAAQTVATMAQSGMGIDEVPDNYFDYLDAKSGYASGTSKGLMALGIKQQQRQNMADDIEIKSALTTLLKGLPYGTEIDIGGTLFKSLNQGDIQTGVETNKQTGDVFAYTHNYTTGESTTRFIGNFGNMAYEDFTDENGVTVREYANGQSVIVHDPSQFSGGLATGGIIDLYPDGVKGGQCGRWVNNLMGTKVGDSDKSKMAITDPKLTAETVGIGDIFVQDRSKVNSKYGHIGIINGKFVKNGQIYFKVSESNWNGDEKVTHTREVPASQISGYAHGNFVDPKYNFKSSSSSATTATSSNALSRDAFIKLYIDEWGKTYNSSPNIEDPSISASLDSLYNEYLAAQGESSYSSLELPDLTTSDKQQMYALGLDYNDPDDIAEYLRRKYGETSTSASTGSTTSSGSYYWD